MVIDPVTLDLLGKGLDLGSNLLGSMTPREPMDNSTNLNSSGIAPISFSIGGLYSPAESSAKGEVSSSLTSAPEVGADGWLDKIMLGVGLFAAALLALRLLPKAT